MRRGVALAVLVLTFSSLLTGTASAEPRWLSAQTLRGPTGPNASGQVETAMDARGNAWVAVARSDDAGTPGVPGDDFRLVEVAYRPAGGRFGPWQRMSAPGDQVLYQLDLVANARGDVLVGWNAYNGSNNALRTRVKPAGKGWGPVVALTPVEAGFTADSARFVLSDGGHVAAVWRRGGSGGLIYGTTGTVAGGWGLPAPISTGGESVYLPAVAVDPRGNTIFAWEGDVATDRWLIRTREKPAGQGPGAVTTRSPDSAGTLAQAPQVAMAADGAATLVWQVIQGESSIVTATRSAPASWAAGTWTSSSGFQTISVPAQTESVTQPTLVVTRDNTAVTAWSATVGGNQLVQVAVRRPGQAFGPPQGVSGAGSSGYTVDLAAGSGGQVVAAFRGPSGAQQVVQASTLSPGATSFADTVDVVTPGGDELLADDPTVAVDAAGDAIATAPIQLCAPGCSSPRLVVRTVGYDAAAPTGAAVAGPAIVGLGRPARLTASGTDVWSALKVGWSFGDGQSASGTSVSHAYRRAGTYRVTARVGDAVGNAVARTTSVQVVRVASGKVVARFRAGATTDVTALQVTRLARGSTVTVQCRGKGCPVRRIVARSKRMTRVSFTRALSARSRIRPGARLTVRVAAPGVATRTVTYTVRRKAAPRVTAGCTTSRGQAFPC